MRKNTLGLVAMLGLSVVLAGCNINTGNVEYDLTNEMGRQLHCLDQFQKEIKADSYGAEMKPEVSNGFVITLEGNVKAKDKEYHLVCTYSDDAGDFTMEFVPLSSETFDLQTEEGRIAACEERAGYYLNFNEGTFVWNDESEGGASFVRNGHVTYLKWGENAEDDVECVVDMADRVVTVEFSNHIYNGELQEERPVTDTPVAKMRVVEGETAEETMARMEEACENMGGEGTDGVCTLDDGSVVAF